MKCVCRKSPSVSTNVTSTPVRVALQVRASSNDHITVSHQCSSIAVLNCSVSKLPHSNLSRTQLIDESAVKRAASQGLGHPGTLGSPPPRRPPWTETPGDGTPCSVFVCTYMLVIMLVCLCVFICVCVCLCSQQEEMKMNVQSVSLT